ncbi:MAG: FAD-dependent oxidoreductase [Bacteroidales bacterium]|nr:FAD-dependent oxidoreductase [Bacteroidales bacterium]MCF8391039.1 FAD-dependent oxidoreductase [Bacteroidales bacterium]
MEKRKPIVIIGAGMAGITAAVEIAEVGHEVILIEKEAYFGGNVIKMNNYFPKLCPPACGLEINFRRIKNNHRIKYYTNTTITNVAGEKGNFCLSLKTSAQFVKDNCTACGKCLDVCPVERPDDFNQNLNKTKAIYLPHDMAFPAKFSIDENYCRKEECNACAEVCDYNAIDFSLKENQFTIDADSIIIATGWRNYDASLIENLHYDDFQNVVTNVEFERMLAPGGPGKGKVERISDNKTPKEIAFVQCAGSRDEKHLSYCSAVCCSASLKHALNMQTLYPDSKIKIFYVDLRVSGRNEDFLNKVKNNKNIELIKGKVAAIFEEENGDLLVEAEDILLGKKSKYKADLVVLATGIVPASPQFTLNKNESGFILDTQIEGIHPIACSKKPMDVSASVKDATAAALKAIQI